MEEEKRLLRSHNVYSGFDTWMRHFMSKPFAIKCTTQILCSQFKVEGAKVIHVVHQSQRQCRECHFIPTSWLWCNLRIGLRFSSLESCLQLTLQKLCINDSNVLVSETALALDCFYFSGPHSACSYVQIMLCARNVNVVRHLCGSTQTWRECLRLLAQCITDSQCCHIAFNNTWLLFNTRVKWADDYMPWN